MKLVPALAAVALVGTSVTTTAQRMPQDNWRLSGVQFGSPTENTLRSIAVSATSVYVGEVNGGKPTKVLQFSKSGTFVRRFADNLGYILGIACDPAGDVYVLDRSDSRVKKYDANGVFIREWGHWGNRDGDFFLDLSDGNDMIDVASNGEVYVCDPGNSRVQVFNSDGGFVRKWGEAGTLPGQFHTGFPTSIAVSDDGSVFLASSYASGNPYPKNLKCFTSTGLFKSATREGSQGANHLAVSLDGTLCATFPSSYGWEPSLLDPFNAWQGINTIVPTYVSTGAGTLFFNVVSGAFSAEGDYYAINDQSSYSMKKLVHVAVREYNYASNFPSAPAIPHPLVLAAAQRPGTNLVDVDYQVTDSDSATVTTALLAVREGDDENRIGNSIAMKTFLEGTTGNVGPNQSTGSSKRVTWNMPADWGVDYATIKVQVMAKDSRNLLGIHWITVPASGGQPAMQVSSEPIREAHLHDLWLWFIGTGQVSQSYVKDPSYGWLGTATGTTGVYTGVKLAVDEYWNEPNRGSFLHTHTLSSGRLYALEQMGARPINAAELIRAQGGRYGFTSLDLNSIVRISAPATSYLKGWGNNNFGQAGWQSFSTPNISKVVAGGDVTFSIRADGSLWGLGYNGHGQLGDGTTTDRTGPLQIATGVTQVATSGNHTLFVKTDGSLWAMGYNGYGQLGDNSTTSRSTPVQIATGVDKVAVGANHSLFVKTDGTLFAMGYNNYGQLGDTTTTNRIVPVQIATGVVQAAGGSEFSLYLKSTGTLFAMGRNYEGQLGDTTTNTRQTPVQIATGVTQISAGSSHSAFVKTTGALFTMGSNQFGQLGDSSTTSRSTPVQIATGVAQACAGSQHTAFRKTDNTVWSVGYNGYGQLGDGTMTNRSVAAQFDVNSSDLTVGANHTLSITLP